MPPTPLATTAVQEQCVRARLGELFAVWITMPEHTELVEMMRRETLAAARVPGHDVGSVTPTRRSSIGADDAVVPPRGATAVHGANYRFQSVDEMDRRALSPGGSSPISPGSGARVVDPSLPLAASPESRALSNPRASPTEGGLDARHMRGQRDTMGPTTSTSSVDWAAGGHGGSLAQSINHLMRQASPSHQAASYSDVPPFFFARGRADSSPTGNAEEQRQLAAAFSGAGARGIKRDQIHAVCRALDVPVWMSGVVFNRLAQLGNQSHVELTNPAAVVRLAEAKRLSEQLANLSPNRRLFELMRGAGAIGSTNPDAAPPAAGRRGSDSLSAEDLVATTRSLVEFHAGLEFLSQEEFQAAYCRTVAYRMLYLHDPLQTRTISWPEFDRSRIPTVLRSLDQTTDINSVLEFFSYEHFYVLYCRFWELDTDKDGHVSLSDLRLYSRGTINPRALQRVVEGRGRRLTSAREGYLNFEDFVYFCLSEEDKTSVPARRYWFNVLDLDGDGVLSGHELGVFFEEQRARLQEMMYEPVRLEDIICQMFDMITPHMLLKQGLRFEEIRRCEGAIDVFFNVFVNAEKFMAFETRNPSEEHQMRQMSQEPTAWDRFARAEYDRLAQEAQQQ